MSNVKKEEKVQKETSNDKKEENAVDYQEGKVILIVWWGLVHVNEILLLTRDADCLIGPPAI